jgi:putative hydrolase of the HAD superfamily
MIKAILFDMVGVLVFKKKNYSAKTQDEINAENIEKLFNHLDDNKLILDIRQNLQLSNTEIEQAARLIPEKYEKFEKLWKLLPELKKKYKLAVINNGNAIALKHWKEKFDFSIFDLCINSAVEGVKKPDPKIFLLACERLNVKPEECLFMDDSLENIESAKRLGMETIWWDRKNGKDIFSKALLRLI